MLFGIDRRWLYVIAIYIILFLLILVTNQYYQKQDSSTYTTPSTNPSSNGIASETQRNGGKEVFHISNNSFTYPEAKCLCKSYGGDLADLSHLASSFNTGANWCSDGWSKGQ